MGHQDARLARAERARSRQPMGRKLEAWKQAAETPDRVTRMSSDPQGENLAFRDSPAPLD